MSSIKSNSKDLLNSSLDDSNSVSLFEKFALRMDQWKCNACLVKNDNTSDQCKACLTAKPQTSLFENISSAQPNMSETKNTFFNFSPTGKKWQCVCSVQNDASALQCSSCNKEKIVEPKLIINSNLKIDNNDKKEANQEKPFFDFSKNSSDLLKSSIFESSSTSAPFSFGLTSNVNSTSSRKVPTIFEKNEDNIISESISPISKPSTALNLNESKNLLDGAVQSTSAERVSNDSKLKRSSLISENVSSAETFSMDQNIFKKFAETKNTISKVNENNNLVLNLNSNDKNFKHDSKTDTNNYDANLVSSSPFNFQSSTSHSSNSDKSEIKNDMFQFNTSSSTLNTPFTFGLPAKDLKNSSNEENNSQSVFDTTSKSESTLSYISNKVQTEPMDSKTNQNPFNSSIKKEDEVTESSDPQLISSYKTGIFEKNEFKDCQKSENLKSISNEKNISELDSTQSTCHAKNESTNHPFVFGSSTNSLSDNSNSKLSKKKINNEVLANTQESSCNFKFGETTLENNISSKSTTIGGLHLVYLIIINLCLLPM